jgi:hypothetical protein
MDLQPPSFWRIQYSVLAQQKFEFALNYMHQIIEFAVASDIVDANLLSRVFECWRLLLAKRRDIALPNFMNLSELGFAIALCKEDAAKLNAVIEVIVTAFPPAKALEVIELCNPRGSELLLRSLHSCEEQNEPHVCLTIGIKLFIEVNLHLFLLIESL